MVTGSGDAWGIPGFCSANRNPTGRTEIHLDLLAVPSARCQQLLAMFRYGRKGKSYWGTRRRRALWAAAIPPRLWSPGFLPT
jgi:hypothetical protein